MAAALLALLDPGDEVVLFEPMYDSYAAGDRPGRRRRPARCRSARPADGAGPLDVRPGRAAGRDHPAHQAAAAQHPAQPHRQGVHPPTSWPLIADLAVEHDLLVLTDEVYEHLVFDGAQHRSIATLPGMRERTLVVSSAGKTFNITGWKIGWICGPAPLVAAVRTAKQFLTYVSGGPFQPAVAAGLGLPDDVLRRAPPATCEYRRDVLVQGPAGRRPPGGQPGGDVLRHRRHPPGAARRRRPGVLPRAARAVRRGRRPQRGVLRPGARRTWAGTWCGSRSARATTCSAEAVRPGWRAEDVGMRIAAVQHDIVWEDRDANFARLAPQVARAVGAGAELVAAHRDVLHRLLDDAGDRRARGRPVGAVPRRAGRGARRLGRRHLPRGRRRGTSCPTTPSSSPGPTAPRTATARSTRSPTPASTSGSAPARSR